MEGIGFYHDEHGIIHVVLPATEDTPQPDVKPSKASNENAST